VAPEQGWDRETTLSHLARKAGLEPGDWRRPDATFLLFEAQVFGEDTPGR
jgi:AMMECR1 domain-containing protein